MCDKLQPSYKSRILLLDKDIRRADSVYRYLFEANYGIYVANSIASSFDILDSNTVDIAIINMDVVGRLGVDLARMLKQRYVTPFLVVSSQIDCDLTKTLIDLGAMACITEPVEQKQLRAHIEVALCRSVDIGILRAANEGLKLLLSDKRKTNVAVGMMMERYRVSRIEAYDALCSLAKAQQRVLHQVVEDVVNAV